MDPVILNEIKFKPSISRVFKKLHVKKGTSHEELVISLVTQAQQTARPKAMYAIAGIDHIDEKSVVLDGIRMESRVMSVNLNGIHRVFPYISSSGRELYDWKQSKQDILEKYFAEEISQMALRTAGDFLLSHLKEKYGVGKTSSMNPGSLKDWPITAQPSLFQLLGNPFDAIGVELHDSMLMIPNQSVSGIRFESDQDFSSCQLCPREVCSHRRAPYDQDLLQNKYQ
jgi:hypothetical protein